MLLTLNHRTSTAKASGKMGPGENKVQAIRISSFTLVFKNCHNGCRLLLRLLLCSENRVQENIYYARNNRCNDDKPVFLQKKMVSLRDDVVI